eukprot:7316603-Prymnesium_polylepis.1
MKERLHSGGALCMNRPSCAFLLSRRKFSAVNGQIWMRGTALVPSRSVLLNHLANFSVYSGGAIMLKIFTSKPP